MKPALIVDFAPWALPGVKVLRDEMIGMNREVKFEYYGHPLRYVYINEGSRVLYFEQGESLYSDLLDPSNRLYINNSRERHDPYGASIREFRAYLAIGYQKLFTQMLKSGHTKDTMPVHGTIDYAYEDGYCASLGEKWLTLDGKYAEVQVKALFGYHFVLKKTLARLTFLEVGETQPFHTEILDDAVPAYTMCVRANWAVRRVLAEYAMPHRKLWGAKV